MSSCDIIILFNSSNAAVAVIQASTSFKKGSHNVILRSFMSFIIFFDAVRHKTINNTDLQVIVLLLLLVNFLFQNVVLKSFRSDLQYSQL
ncbi:hypothetical protein HOB94_00300 [bacterium]|jgi:hypothetical protein|nr:hypothetical protein [bacterium]MBT4632464.1 hypothetical protein [bacterium]MBT5491672.1 hypothetical protein [bacterium]MBT6778959.1 hypothetical protein [bacterium]